MNKEDVRLAVIGAGAIGGVTAAYICQSGWDVEVVCKHRETVDKVNTAGFDILGLKQSRIPVPAVQHVEELSGPKDFILLAVKATDCLEVAEKAKPFLKPESLLVSLQNGISEPALAEVVGPERVIGCVVGWGAGMHGPGRLEVTSPGEFVIGTLDNHPEPRLPILKDMLDTVVPCRISENIMGELYSKLMINACINSLGVITGQPLGKLLADRRVRKVFIELMREALAVAEAMKVRVEPGGGGRIDYYNFLSGNGFAADFKRHFMIRMIGFKYRRIRSSSLQSLERGRRTEVDYLNGYIRNQGRLWGVATPLNDAVYELIKEIEKGVRKIGPENLADERVAL